MRCDAELSNSRKWDNLGPLGLHTQGTRKIGLSTSREEGLEAKMIEREAMTSHS